MGTETWDSVEVFSVLSGEDLCSSSSDGNPLPGARSSTWGLGGPRTWVCGPSPAAVMRQAFHTEECGPRPPLPILPAKATWFYFMDSPPCRGNAFVALSV